MSKVQRDPAPTTFRERLLAHENQRHAARLAEIKKAEARLRAFEPTAAALEARGIHLSCTYTLGNWDKELHLTCGVITESNNLLHDALIELGFTQTERTAAGSYAHVALKQGRQKLRLLIKADHQYSPEKAAVPAAGANHGD